MNHSSSRLSAKRRWPCRWGRWEEEGQGQEALGGVETERVKGWCCHIYPSVKGVMVSRIWRWRLWSVAMLVVVGESVYMA